MQKKQLQSDFCLHQELVFLNAPVLLKVGVVDAVTSFPFPPFILLVILATASFYFSKKESSNTDQ